MVNIGGKSFQGNVKRNTCDVSGLLYSLGYQVPWICVGHNEVCRQSEVEYTAQCQKAGPQSRVRGYPLSRTTNRSTRQTASKNGSGGNAGVNLSQDLNLIKHLWKEMQRDCTHQYWEIWSTSLRKCGSDDQQCRYLIGNVGILQKEDIQKMLNYSHCLQRLCYKILN